MAAHQASEFRSSEESARLAHRAARTSLVRAHKGSMETAITNPAEGTVQS